MFGGCKGFSGKSHLEVFLSFQEVFEGSPNSTYAPISNPPETLAPADPRTQTIDLMNPCHSFCSGDRAGVGGSVQTVRLTELEQIPKSLGGILGTAPSRCFISKDSYIARVSRCSQFIF